MDAGPRHLVTLNTRQHAMADVALRVPAGQTDAPSREVMVHLLRDGFDGGSFEGWRRPAGPSRRETEDAR